MQKDEWEWDERESVFLQYVKSFVRNKGLYLDETDIYNFHISAKTNMLTILGGIPGAGKSRFVQAYAEALGLQYGKNWFGSRFRHRIKNHMIYLVTFTQMVLLLKVKQN